MTPPVGTVIERPRAVVEIGDVWAAKTFDDPDTLERELGWSQRLPWIACPVIERTGDTLVMERLDMAVDVPEWRPVDELRALLVRLGAEGVHHRDLHVLNVGRDRRGAVRVIDWEWTIGGMPGRSFDLFGPEMSGVPDHRHPNGHPPIWWWGLLEEVPGRWWG